MLDCPAVDYKMISEAFVSGFPLQRASGASVYASGAIKSNENITEYIYYFISCPVPLESENQLWSTARAPDGLGGKKSTFPVAVLMLLLLIKKSLAAVLERTRIECPCLSPPRCWARTGPKARGGGGAGLLPCTNGS